MDGDRLFDGTDSTGSLAIFGMVSTLAVAVILILSLWLTIGKTATPVVAPSRSHTTTTVQPPASTVPFVLESTCESDSRTIDIAVSAAMAENPRSYPTTASGWRSGLLTSVLSGGPFLQEWPEENGYYTISVAGTRSPADNGDGVRPSDGDVIVTVAATGKRFDFTAEPLQACSELAAP